MKKKSEYLAFLNATKKTLPPKGKAVLKISTQGIIYIECKVRPSLSEKDFMTCINMQEKVLGKKNISEFYTEETGSHWLIYLKTK